MTEPSISEIADSLRSVKGNIAAAAQRLGLTRVHLEAVVAQNATLAALIDDYRFELVDFAETVLRNAVGKGEEWAIRYVLDSSRAASRGWRKMTASTPTPAPGASPADGGGMKSLTDEQLADANRRILEG